MLDVSSKLEFLNLRFDYKEMKMDIDEYLKEFHINCVRKNITRKFNVNLTTSVQKEEDFTQNKKNVVQDINKKELEEPKC